VSGNYETTEGDMSSTKQQASEIKRTRQQGPGAGHWLAEQAPEEMLAALTEFLAPYREEGGGLR
jgi:pimeloyl-ACP methyl ester carboxylesterase